MTLSYVDKGSGKDICIGGKDVLKTIYQSACERGLHESIMLDEQGPFYYPNSNSMCLHQVPTYDRHMYKTSKIQETLNYTNSMGMCVH